MLETRALSPDEERELATELAREAAGGVAPTEVLLFDEIAAEFWKDPGSAVRDGAGPEAVGFGIDAALVTPVLLAMAMPVIKELAAQLGAAVKEKAGTRLTVLVRRALRLPVTGPPEVLDEVPALSREQLGRVRDAAAKEARRLGVEPPVAAVLADAITGRLATAG